MPILLADPGLLTPGREFLLVCASGKRSLAAARELRNYVNEQDLKCESSRQDQYRRVLAICFMPDGSDLNAWMVRQGWAVAFRTTKRYRPEQDEAAAAKRGLWAGAFVMPWEWRDRNRRRAADTGI